MKRRKVFVVFGILLSFMIIKAYSAEAALNGPSLSIPQIDVPVNPDLDIAASNCGLGQVSFQMGERDKALEYFSECIKYSPEDYLDGYTYRSQLYLILAKESKDKKEKVTLYTNAFADFNQLINHGSQSKDDYEGRAEAYTGLGDTQNAAADQRKASEIKNR